MDGLVVRYFLIIGVRVLDRTISYTCCTTGAFVLYNVSWFLDQVDREISCLPLYTDNFRKCQNLYVWMPADLDQFG